MSAVIVPFESLERPLARLRCAIEQAERELDAVRRGYLVAVELAGTLAPEGPDPYDLGPLSRQELRVARLLQRGLTNSDISSSLHVSVHTVKSHVRSILRKRGLHSRWQLVSSTPAMAVDIQ
jgi:DNA-binding NarL/FixJ family response regulator